MPSRVTLAWGDRGDLNSLVTGFTGQRLGHFGFGRHEEELAAPR
jgi:hypothetical protein